MPVGPSFVRFTAIFWHSLSTDWRDTSMARRPCGVLMEGNLRGDPMCAVCEANTRDEAEPDGHRNLAIKSDLESQT